MNNIKQTNRLWWDLVREQAIPLFVLFAVTSAISLTLEDLMLHLTHNEEDQRWILQLGLGIVDLIEGVTQILMLSWGIPKVRSLTEAHFMRSPFETGYLNSFLAEYLRTLASVLLRALLFIVPGFLRYARLLFVPFITLFAKPYRDGEVDAFELSIALTRGRTKLIIGLVLVSMLAQLGLELLPQGEMFHALPWRLSCAGLSFLFSAWIFAFSYLLFEQAMEEHAWT